MLINNIYKYTISKLAIQKQSKRKNKTTSTECRKKEK